MKAALILFTLFMIGIGLFNLFPQWDSASIHWFYNEQEKVFPLARHPVLRVIHRGIYVLTTCVAITLVAYALFLFSRKFFIFPRRYPAPVSARVTLFLIISLLIGPGILVNSIFKDQWGRPRPSQTSEFGGENKFVPAFKWSNQGGKSLLSGHAAVAFYLAALAFAFKTPMIRYSIYTGGILFGFLVGAARMAEGRHYLSDIILCGLLVLTVIHVCKAWILDRGRPYPSG